MGLTTAHLNNSGLDDDQHPLPVSIVIVGAGPIGLAAANLLGLAGIDTLILERNTTVSDYPKAISLMMKVYASVRPCGWVMPSTATQS